jgi:hypothetical protein
MNDSDGWLMDADFQRAFVAVRYAAGARDATPLAPFARPNDGALELLRTLSSGVRQERAQALAVELKRIARVLEARRLR